CSSRIARGRVCHRRIESGWHAPREPPTASRRESPSDSDYKSRVFRLRSAPRVCLAGTFSWSIPRKFPLDAPFTAGREAVSGASQANSNGRAGSRVPGVPFGMRFARDTSRSQPTRLRDNWGIFVRRAGLFAVALAILLHAVLAAQQVGSNINVLPAYVDPNDPTAFLKGDLF